MPNWANEEFLTVAEVAGLLKLNQQTVRNWLDDGKLPSVRVGRRVRVLRSDLNALIERSYTGRTPAPEDAKTDAHAADFWGSEER